MSRQGQNVGRKIIAADIFARNIVADLKHRRQLARYACVCVSFYQYSVPDGTASIIKMPVY
ncbi:MAG: hypothetical protein LBS69_09860 [Prevotellaceae bacterium]|jgi:hypothetical protein|nr:hypothetical protein [Prevotellaceae bacterium]